MMRVVLLRNRLDKEGSVIYAIAFVNMSAPMDKPRPGTVKQKITSDFILDEYEKVRHYRGKPRKDALKQLHKLSENMGSYLVKEDRA